MKEDTKKELERLASLPDNEIDTSDITEDKDWASAVRGRFYRPSENKPKSTTD